MVHYKLIYFDVRGRAELIRQVFKLAGVEFEDNRVTREEWAEIKNKTPFGKCPVLEVDSKQIPESFAIARYVARQVGLAGKTPFDSAWVDAFADQLKDYQSENSPFWMVMLGYKEGDKAAAEKEHGIPARDKFYSIIEKRLAESKSGFLVGDSATWADIAIADQSWKMVDKLPGWLDKYPKAIAHYKKVHSLPGLKEWIETRPVTSI